MTSAPEWREGARRDDPADCCPGCGTAGVMTWDFKKLGKHTLHYCPVVCRALFVDGQGAADVKEGP